MLIAPKGEFSNVKNGFLNCFIVLSPKIPLAIRDLQDLVGYLIKMSVLCPYFLDFALGPPRFLPGLIANINFKGNSTRKTLEAYKKLGCKTKQKERKLYFLVLYKHLLNDRSNFAAVMVCFLFSEGKGKYASFLTLFKTVSFIAHRSNYIQ